MKKNIEELRDVLQDKLLEIVENYEVEHDELDDDVHALTDMMVDGLVEICNETLAGEEGKVAFQFTFHDVMKWRPDWDEEECKSWLSDNHDYLTTYMHTMSLGVLCSTIDRELE